MQNRHAFEKRIIEAKREIAAVLAGERAPESGTILQTAIHLCGRCQSAGAALKSREPISRKERAAFHAEVKELEEAALLNHFSSTPHWQELSTFLQHYHPRRIAAGAEQTVYLKEDGRTVLKLNTGLFHATWLDFFTRLLLHAALFPDTAYDIAGFTIEDGALLVMLEQPWAAATRGASQEEVEAFLISLNFIRLRSNDYYHKGQGIILEDLHDENVFIGLNDNLIFVDPVIYLETPDLGLGGPSQFTFPFTK